MLSVSAAAMMTFGVKLLLTLALTLPTCYPESFAVDKFWNGSIYHTGTMLNETQWKIVQNCSHFTKQSEDLSFYMVQGTANYSASKMACNDLGGTLAITRSAHDESHLNCAIRNTALYLDYEYTAFWIGLRTFGKPGDNTSYRWEDGSTPSYTNWIKTAKMVEPNNLPQHTCVGKLIQHGLKWHNSLCFKIQYFVCSLKMRYTYHNRPPPPTKTTVSETSTTALTTTTKTPETSTATSTVATTTSIVPARSTTNRVTVSRTTTISTTTKTKVTPTQLSPNTDSSKTVDNTTNCSFNKTHPPSIPPLDKCMSLLLKAMRANQSSAQSFSRIARFVQNVNQIANEISPFFYQEIVSLANMVNNGTTEATFDTKEMLTRNLEELAYKVILQNSQYATSSGDIQIQIKDEMSPNSSLVYRPLINHTMQPNPVTVVVPLEALKQVEGANCQNGITGQCLARTVFVLYQNTTMFRSQKKTAMEFVVSASVGKKSGIKHVSNLKTPVTVVHSYINTSAGKKQNDSTLKAVYVNQTCVAWNYSTGSWSGQGCHLVENSNPPVCKCNHMTNFAMLMMVYDVAPDIALDRASVVLCSLSVVCLLLTVIILLKSRNIRHRGPMKVLINICLNLAASYLVFLCGVEHRIQAIACVFGATLLQYFLLVTWCWMAVYIFFLFRSIVQVFNVFGSTYLRLAYLFSYGCPALVVVLTLGVAKGLEDPVVPFPRNLLASNMCWIEGNYLYVGFLLPIGLMLLFNIVMFGLVFRSLLSKSEKVRSTTKRPRNRDHLAIAATIASTLGLVWIFAYLMMLSKDPTYLRAMSWIFAILAGTQGLCIFVLTCVRRGDVKLTWWPPIRDVICCANRRKAIGERTATSGTPQETGKGTSDIKSGTLLTPA